MNFFSSWENAPATDEISFASSPYATGKVIWWSFTVLVASSMLSVEAAKRRTSNFSKASANFWKSANCWRQKGHHPPRYRRTSPHEPVNSFGSSKVNPVIDLNIISGKESPVSNLVFSVKGITTPFDLIFCRGHDFFLDIGSSGHIVIVMHSQAHRKFKSCHERHCYCIRINAWAALTPSR